MHFDESPRTEDGLLDPLALVVLSDTMVGAVSERVGPGQPLWLVPSADLTVHLFGAPSSEWLLAHKRARRAGDGYVSLELALWDPALGLMSHSVSMCLFTFPEGPPPDKAIHAPG